MATHFIEIALRDGEIQGDQRRVREVQKPRRKAVMLSEYHLPPDRLTDRRILQHRVLREILQDQRLEHRLQIPAVPVQAENGTYTQFVGHKVIVPAEAELFEEGPEGIISSGTVRQGILLDISGEKDGFLEIADSPFLIQGIKSLK